ncbi:uncharacterized protein LOC132759704 [Ruditapes philippinarum]|uniref:uncharacterized protein LOC132759704 n=1 Tax=Ruditapes philippinarum TaxID=129788 RepID=UPI00295BA3FD|nr:uncharacterized protein LOC132759704 [Ruditapes philippinarum]
MAYKQQYDGSPEWLDTISRLGQSEESFLSSEAKLTSEKSKEETKDKDFYGFHGLNVHLYRVLREDESIENGIFCQDKDSSRSVEQHIASGSKYKSKFISTTSSLDVARYWAYFEMNTPERKARKVPLRIVEIDIQLLAGTKYEKKCINLCNEEVRNHFIKGAIHKNWAKSSQEVLFVVEIPKFVSLQQPTLVFWLKTDASRPKSPTPKEEKKDLVAKMGSMNLK